MTTAALGRPGEGTPHSDRNIGSRSRPGRAAVSTVFCFSSPITAEPGWGPIAVLERADGLGCHVSERLADSLVIYWEPEPPQASTLQNLCLRGHPVPSAHLTHGGCKIKDGVWPEIARCCFQESRLMPFWQFDLNPQRRASLPGRGNVTKAVTAKSKRLPQGEDLNQDCRLVPFLGF